MLRSLILVAMLAAPAAAQTTPPAAGSPVPVDIFQPGTELSAIICEVDTVHGDPQEADDAAAADAPRIVRLSDPWGEAMLTGAGDPVHVTLFGRERTLIFDAQSEFLYLDRQNHHFSYTLFGKDGVTIWRGLCRAEG